MDSLAGMDRLPYEPGRDGEARQENVAAPENICGEDYFADVQTLEYSPFEEGEDEKREEYPSDTELAETEEYPDDADLMEMEEYPDDTDSVEMEEYLPVDPARIPDESLTVRGAQPEGETGQQYAEEPNTEGTDEEKTGEESPTAGDGSEGKSSREESAEEDRKRAEHEASEAKRRAEWEAGQQARKEAEKAQMERIMSMGSEELAAESMKRVGADTEKLVRRNMKECVSEYVQTMCLEDEGFARQVMLPRKNMIRCFQYINRKAYEYVQDEMKAAGVQPGRDMPCYSSDIPDDVCYHWAEEYFRTMDVKEDKEEEEKFVPKPYTGKSGSKAVSKKSAGKKPASRKADGKKTADNAGKEEKKAGGQAAEKKPKETAGDGQLSLTGQMSFADFAA